MNRILIKNGYVWFQNKFVKQDILIVNTKITRLAKRINDEKAKIIDANGLHVLPGLVDVHVHLREPGYEYKETIKTGTMSAAAGGYTTICCMPNTKPIIDNLSTLNNLKKLIKQKAIVNILPYASITKQEKGQALVNIPSLAKHCFAFSDDGVGIASSDLMFKAMQQCKKVNKVIVAHCEDISQKNSNAKESKEVERNLKLASKTKCQLHICHVSTHESINLIKKAKAQKVNVSCEVTPHHLLLNKNNVINQGTYKMNPPLANPKDQQVLKKALADGTIDMIVTDHAPHADKEKNTTYEKSLNGIVGLETAFSLIYTHFVKTKAISFSRMINLMSLNPCKIFKIKSHQIILNNTANITIMDLNTKWAINNNEFKSKGKSTPFNHHNVFSKAKYTIVNGQIV